MLDRIADRVDEVCRGTYYLPLEEQVEHLLTRIRRLQAELDAHEERAAEHVGEVVRINMSLERRITGGKKP